MNILRAIGVILALLGIYGIAGRDEHPDAVAHQQEATERRQASERFMRDVCEVRGSVAVVDNTGRVVCPDSSPSWSLSHPLLAAEVQPK